MCTYFLKIFFVSFIYTCMYIRRARLLSWKFLSRKGIYDVRRRYFVKRTRRGDDSAWIYIFRLRSGGQDSTRRFFVPVLAYGRTAELLSRRQVPSSCLLSRLQKVRSLRARVRSPKFPTFRDARCRASKLNALRSRPERLLIARGEPTSRRRITKCRIISWLSSLCHSSRRISPMSVVHRHS